MPPSLPTESSERRETMRAAGRGLDWLNLSVANIQTGFGPFVAVYLATEGWTQTAIGLALSIGTLTSMLSQVPAGALVDAMPSKSRVAVFSILAFTASALMFALSPTPLSVYLAEVLHGMSSCTLGPAIAAMSLGLAGPLAISLRLGRNSRYASIGNGVGAALMGACGYLLSERAVFFLTAALTLPAFIALRPLARIETPPPIEHDRRNEPPPGPARPFRALMSDRRLLVFAACALLFTFANSPMLPLAGAAVTKRAGDYATLMIAACIVLPQLIVAVISPRLGVEAQLRGRRPLLLLGFAMLPIRGVLLALFEHPVAVVLIQALDGIAGACFGLLVPLIVADIAGRSGRFNFTLGLVGLGMGLGGTASPVLAGWIADQASVDVAFYVLSAVGLAATALARWAMPETRPTA